MNGKVMLFRQFASLCCCAGADPDVPGDIQAAPEVVENGKLYPRVRALRAATVEPHIQGPPLQDPVVAPLEAAPAPIIDAPEAVASVADAEAEGSGDAGESHSLRIRKALTTTMKKPHSSH